MAPGSSEKSRPNPTQTSVSVALRGQRARKNWGFAPVPRGKEAKDQGHAWISRDFRRGAAVRGSSGSLASLGGRPLLAGASSPPGGDVGVGLRGQVRDP